MKGHPAVGLSSLWPSITDAVCSPTTGFSPLNMYNMYEKLQAGVETAATAAAISGFPECWYALANKNTDSTNSTEQKNDWCSLTLELSKEWEVCENCDVSAR